MRAMALPRWGAMCCAAGMLVLGAATAGRADPGPNPSCQNGGVLSAALLTSICWDCLFPIRIGGVASLGTTGTQNGASGGNCTPGAETGNPAAALANAGMGCNPGPVGSASVPHGATSKAACVCKGKNGLPDPGVTIGFWNPFQIAEIVRTPGCSLSLGGMILPSVDPLNIGTKGRGEGENQDATFLHYHTYSFPLLRMLDLFFNEQCSGGMLSDFDILFLSEIDPTWTYDALAFFTAPESAAASLPPAQLACLADAVTTTASLPIDQLFWCAGSWGSIYPLSGRGDGRRSPVAYSSLLATRSLAIQHRRGLAARTMGDDALCGGVFDPLMTKSQYRMSMFWPRPEANGSHVIGQLTVIWGEWRSLPAVGEDATYLLWRWQDCCLGLL